MLILKDLTKAKLTALPYSRTEFELLRKFGTVIRKLRNQAGITQEELAFRAGLDRTYVGGVERGERNISIINIFRLANALGVTVEQLFSAFKQ